MLKKAKKAIALMLTCFLQFNNVANINQND